MAWHCNKIFFIFIGPSSEVIKLQKEASDLKKEREELTKLLKNLEKDKSAWQKQSDDLNNLKKEQSSIKKDKDALTQNLKTMEKELKKVLKDVQPKKVCMFCSSWTLYFYARETSKYCPSPSVFLKKSRKIRTDYS